MKIQFLGSGGAFTDWRENYNNNALIETNAGWVLLDCGVTAVQSMKELGVHPSDIRRGGNGIAIDEQQRFVSQLHKKVGSISLWYSIYMLEELSDGLQHRT